MSSKHKDVSYLVFTQISKLTAKNHTAIQNFGKLLVKALYFVIKN